MGAQPPPDCEGISSNREREHAHRFSWIYPQEPCAQKIKGHGLRHVPARTLPQVLAKLVVVLQSPVCLAARNRSDYRCWRRVLGVPADHSIGGGAIIFQAGVRTNCGGKDHIVSSDRACSDSGNGVLKRILGAERAGYTSRAAQGGIEQTGSRGGRPSSRTTSGRSRSQNS